MSYVARVFKVFIASPSDVQLEREQIHAAIAQWNDLHAEKTKIMMLPVGWDTSAAPELGRPAQDYINLDILDKCDIVIGVFWTRVGTPTRNNVSGSVEEILRSSEKRRLTMLYFSNKSVELAKVDTKQYEALQKFKKKIQKENRGMYIEFGDNDDFEQMIYRHLQIKVNEDKLRPMWDSDKLAQIKDDEELCAQIPQYFPAVSENLLKAILYEERSDKVWEAITQRLLSSPPDLRNSLLFLAEAGACNHYVFREGSVRLAKKSQADFCIFLNHLYSINKYEFKKLYSSEYLTDKLYRQYLENIIKRDAFLEGENL